MPNEFHADLLGGWGDALSPSALKVEPGESQFLSWCEGGSQSSFPYAPTWMDASHVRLACMCKYIAIVLPFGTSCF